MANGSFLVAVLLSLALSGCSTDSGIPNPPASSGKDPGPVEGEPIELQNRTILDQDFVANAAQAQSAMIEVPHSLPNGTRIWIWAQTDRGAWDDFVLGGLPDECLTLTTQTDPSVSLGTNNGSGGSTCIVEPGRHEISWKVQTGVVTGHLTVKAEVPV